METKNIKVENNSEKKSFEKPQTKTKRKSMKKYFYCSLGLGAIALICSLVFGFLFAGGYVKEATCAAVKEDSYIWDQALCDETQRGSSQSSTSEDVVFEQGPTIEFSTDDYQTIEDLVTGIIQQAEHAVVSVTVKEVVVTNNNEQIHEDTGIGTGFVVRSDGVIVTNQHVVSELSADYGVILGGTEEVIPVEEIYRDNINDIAILTIDRTELPTLPLGNSDSLERGNMVIAIGNALGRYQGTVTVGFISGLGRNISAGGGFFEDTTYYEDVIQTDAAINPGNSGGPLINSSGEVIGVNFATTQGAENISFAIPINRIKGKLAEFEEFGKLLQPYVGVTYDQRPIFIGDEVINGALITGVERNGPADDGGITVGDIILEFNGESMAENTLFSAVQRAPVGEVVEVIVRRDDEEITLEVEIGDRS